MPSKYIKKGPKRLRKALEARRRNLQQILERRRLRKEAAALNQLNFGGGDDVKPVVDSSEASAATKPTASKIWLQQRQEKKESVGEASEEQEDVKPNFDDIKVVVLEDEELGVINDIMDEDIKPGILKLEDDMGSIPEKGASQKQRGPCLKPRMREKLTAARRCLICFKLHSGQKPPLPVFPGSATMSPEATECINKQLWSMFILRNLLRFPREECEKVFLKTSGASNPDSWYSICQSCSRITTEAVEVHQEILKLNERLITLGESIREKLTGSLESEKNYMDVGNDGHYYNISNEVRQYYRSIINKSNQRLEEEDLQELVYNHEFHEPGNITNLDPLSGHHFICLPEGTISSSGLGIKPAKLLMPTRSYQKTRSTRLQTTRKGNKGIRILRGAKAKLTKSKLSIIERRRINSFIVSTDQHPTKKFQCKICNRLCSRRDVATRHIETYHRKEVFFPNPAPDMFECEKCGFQFKKEDRFNYEKHIRKHARDDLTETEPSETGQKFKCKLCSHTFDNRRQIYDHFLGSHPQEVGCAFVCNFCGRQCSSEKYLSRHIAFVHHKIRSYFCKYCAKGFQNKNDHEDHEARHLNNNENIIICDLCGLNFTARKGLGRHMKKFHTKELKIKTGKEAVVQPSPSSSSQTNKMSSSLPVEMSSKTCTDSNATEMECKYCRAKLLNRRMLMLHLKDMHSELYTHKCDLCNASYMTAHNFKIHRESAHSTKKARCQYCDAEFTSYISIYEHLKKSCKKYDGGRKKVKSAKETNSESAAERSYEKLTST